MERKTVHLKYDPNIYSEIVEIGRLIPLDRKSIEPLDRFDNIDDK